MDAKNKQYDGIKTSMTLSVADRNRLDELTSFYRHLNGVVESIIDKFSTMERVTNKFMKTQTFNQGAQPYAYTPLSPLRPVVASPDAASQRSANRANLQQRPEMLPLSSQPITSNPTIVP